MTTSNAFGATIIETHRDTAETTGSGRPPVCPQFQFGRRAVRFSEETATLLRERLAMAALVLAIALVVVLGINLLSGNVLFPVPRIGVLIALVGCHLLLRSRRPLTLNQLLIVEFITMRSPTKTHADAGSVCHEGTAS
ncbi:MAG: hypothetical protein H7062_13340 [Candidatus Saccharimonas sp.]|nr:hypothetical protein [Planctomycetaceae bacterium]